MKLVTDWRDPAFDKLPVGGKARALGALSKAGFSIPPWSVVLPDASQADRHSLEEQLWPFLDLQPGPLAVRSSALDEDGQSHSFAGQLESFLNVRREALMGKIRAVWQSGFSERIVLYRQQAALALPPSVPAVIIQQMVPAESAGVAFSADPVSGRRGIAVVASVRGLGDALVSGEAKRRLVSRGSRRSNCASRIGWPRESVFPTGFPSAASGEPGSPSRPAFWPAAGHRVGASPGTTLAAAVAADHLARRAAGPRRRVNLWDNSNIAESYSGVTTPLTFSSRADVYEEVYRAVLPDDAACPRGASRTNRDLFPPHARPGRGRVYYNLLNWYRAAGAACPGSP